MVWFFRRTADAVAELLIAAKERNREAFYVGGAAFDDIMIRLAHHCLDGNALDASKIILGDHADSERLERAAFSIPQSEPTANSLPVGDVRVSTWEVAGRTGMAMAQRNDGRT